MTGQLAVASLMKRFLINSKKINNNNNNNNNSIKQTEFKNIYNSPVYKVIKKKKKFSKKKNLILIIIID